MRATPAAAVLLLSGVTAAATPAALPPPASPACVYQQPRVERPWTLRLGRGTFAWIKGAARLTLPVGAEATFAHATIEAGGVSLSGFVAADEIELHPTRAFVVGEAVVPRAAAVLRWTHGARGRVGFAYTPAALRLGAGEARGTRPCADLALIERPFDPAAAIKPSGKGRQGWLGRQQPIPLSAQPAGAPVAEIADALRRERVTILATRDEMTRISWEGADVLAFGWVPSARLASARPRPAEIADAGKLGVLPRGDGAHPAAGVTCPFPLPLVAETGSDLRAVGSAGPGVLLERAHGDDRDGLASVRFVTDDIEIPEGARLLVPAQDLARCKPAPAPGSRTWP